MRLEGPDHTALWTPARAFTAEDREMHAKTTIHAMLKAVLEVGAAGLAMPQVGLSLRCFVTNGHGSLPPVVINPSWTQVGEDFISKPEKCLSRLDYSTYMRRPARIQATWEDANGVAQTALLESMDARIFLHLFDLLEGRPIYPRPKAVVPVSLEKRGIGRNAPDIIFDCRGSLAK